MMLSLQLTWNKFLRTLRNTDGWMFLTYSLASYLFVIFCYFLYLQWITPALEQEVFTAQEKLSEQITLYTKANNDPLYKKYKNAKLISKQEAKLQRAKTIPTLIGTLQKLQQQ
jgi:hypothetical protein